MHRAWIASLSKGVATGLSLIAGVAVSRRNRALELIGKELGMFRDLEPVKAPTLDDLSTEKLLAMTPIDARHDRATKRGHSVRTAAARGRTDHPARARESAIR